jgi:hypothetical protein
MGGNKGSAQEQWLKAFENTLSYRNNRLVDVRSNSPTPPPSCTPYQPTTQPFCSLRIHYHQVFNWESISSNADALAALRTALSSALPCLVRLADPKVITSFAY